MDEWQGEKLKSPNMVRAGLRKFLQTTGMTQTATHSPAQTPRGSPLSEGYLSLQALLKILQVNSNSYNRFMNGKYKDQWSATSNNTYDAGSYFLYREKKAGKQSFAALHSSKTAANGGGGTAKVSLPDVSGVVLEDFQVFLTPIEVRKEIQRVLATYKCSQSDIAKAAGAPNGGAVSRFMAKGGEFGLSWWA